MSSHSANDKSSVPQLSVCVVTYGRRNQDVDRALHSVFEYTSDMTVEVILVDNGSSDDTLQMIAEKFPSVVVIHNRENIGYAPAMNMALVQSKGRYVLCLSLDAELLPNSVQTLIALMEKHPRCGLAGPCTLNSNCEVLTTMHHPNLLLSIWGEIIPVKKKLRENSTLRSLATIIAPNSSGLTSNYRKTQRARLLSGGILLLSRKFLDDVGLLDENMPLGPDDYDWCHRAHQKGYEVWYVAESRMIHRQTPKEDVIKLSTIYLYARLPALVYLYRKYHSGLLLRIFILSTLLLSYMWKRKIRRHYGTNSIQFEALRAGHEICLKPELYFSNITAVWPQKSCLFNL